MLLESFQTFPIFLCNQKCRLEHVVNELMSCLITEFLWIFSYKLHGILSNSIDTLWHSMELHRYFREPHGIPWNSTIFPGIPWTSKETPWNFMAFHGTPSLLHGTPWNSMAFHGTPWILHGSFVEFHGFPSISMEFHGGISHGVCVCVCVGVGGCWRGQEFCWAVRKVSPHFAVRKT